MYIRPTYLEQLEKYKDAPIIKILAGIRRSGKSTILRMLRDQLVLSGIKKDHIISFVYTSMEFGDDYDVRRMYEDIVGRFTDDGRYYLLLDEVQEIDDWEKCVNSLFENFNTDIYITGSNSRLMSAEISTLLSGRYISIPVYTLSYNEYWSFKTSTDKSEEDKLMEYIRLGGFPIVALNEYEPEDAYSIIEGIYASVITNDISRRHNISNKDLFNRIVRFIVENVGKTFSANTIVNYLKSDGRKANVEQVYNYIEWLEKAFVIYRCNRYDLQGKSVLKTQEKFYLADSGLKYAIFGYNPKSIAAMLENIVYLELKRRGYNVYIGKLGNREIDFIATKREERLYLQVTRRMPENSQREIENLLMIKDNYPKMIITLDRYETGNVSGVKIISLADFLKCDTGTVLLTQN